MNPGDVVLVKISGEPVFVLDVLNNKYVVRRAVQSDSGVQYVEEGFLPGELTTYEDSLKEEFERQFKAYQIRREYESVKAAYDSKLKEKTQGATDQQLSLVN